MKDNFNKLFNTNPRYSTIFAFILGLVLIDDLDTSEQNMLGEWIMLIAQTIVTNANSQYLIESRIKGRQMNINSKEVKSIYFPFIYDIDKIKSIISTLYPDYNIDTKVLSNYLNDIKNKIDKIKID